MLKKISLLVIILLLFSAGASFAVTKEQRDYVSRQMLSKITKESGEPKELPPDSRVSGIFRSLLKETSRKDVKYRASVVDSKDINAYALPDGQVVFYSGLLKALPADNNAPLAFVAAHELAHIERHHADKKIERALISGGILTILTHKSKEWMQLLGGVAFGLINSGYSREFETDADKQALIMMHKAGYDPNGSLVVFKMFSDMEKKGGGIRIFPSHPKPKDRYKNAIAWMKENHVAIHEPGLTGTTPDAKISAPPPQPAVK